MKEDLTEKMELALIDHYRLQCGKKLFELNKRFKHVRIKEFYVTVEPIKKYEGARLWYQGLIQQFKKWGLGATT